MTHFHAVMIDECGCEFGAGVHAKNHHEARLELSEMFPESRIAQIESPRDRRNRESEMFARIEAEMNGEFYGGDDGW